MSVSRPDASHQILRLGAARISIFTRGTVVSSVLASVVALFLVIALTTGAVDIPPERVWAAITGGGNRAENLVVLTWRLPRALVAVAAGAALGLSGALTQTVTRNGLTSPDLLGVVDGAALAGVLSLTSSLSLGASGVWFVPLAAFVGGVSTGLVVFAIGRWGAMEPLRLVLIGIGVGSVLDGISMLIMVRGKIDTIELLKVWLAGSLNGRGWVHLWPTLIALAVAVVITLRFGFDLRGLSLSPDLADGLGINRRAVSVTLLLTAAGLAAIVVAAVGPIGFVALVAPHLARLMTRAPTPPLGTTAWCGAALLLGADLLAQHVLPIELPVGLVTSAIGGPVLVALLLTSRSKAST